MIQYAAAKDARIRLDQGDRADEKQQRKVNTGVKDSGQRQNNSGRHEADQHPCNPIRAKIGKRNQKQNLKKQQKDLEEQLDDLYSGDAKKDNPVI